MLGDRRWSRLFKGQAEQSLRRTRERFCQRKRTGSWAGDRKKFHRSSRRARKRRKHAGKGIKISFHVACEGGARANRHATYSSRSHNAVIRADGAAGEAIQTDDYTGDFKQS